MALVVKNPPANAEDAREAGLTPGSGRSSAVGNGNQIQHSCLENPMDRRAGRAILYQIRESDRTEVTQHKHELMGGLCSCPVGYVA